MNLKKERAGLYIKRINVERAGLYKFLIFFQKGASRSPYEISERNFYLASDVQVSDVTENLEQRKKEKKK